MLHTLSVMVEYGMAPSQGRLHRDDVYMPMTPMFHVHAWGLPYASTSAGVKQVYPGRYAPDVLLRLIAQEGVTFTHCVPTILQMLLAAPGSKDVDLSKLKIHRGERPPGHFWRLLAGCKARRAIRHPARAGHFRRRDRAAALYGRLVQLSLERANRSLSDRLPDLCDLDRRLVVEKRREHSRKPDCVRDRIERLVGGPYLELFGRETKSGWDCWGNQAGLFDQGATPTRRQPSRLVEAPALLL